MANLSKLHPKCNECSYKDKCNEKRMVACGVMELSPKTRADINALTLEPMAKEYTPITILEEIKSQIEEDLYKRISCSFNRTL